MLHFKDILGKITDCSGSTPVSAFAESTGAGKTKTTIF